MTALVPIKKNSERLNNKNFKQFGGKPLYHWVLDKLQQIENIDRIIINTDSDEIVRCCTKNYSKVVIIDRPEHLVGDEITMNALIEYDLQQIKGEHFLQTHVTNPLIKIETIERAIGSYFDNLNHNDSLIAVTPVKKRVYDHDLKPINHTLEVLEMTQNLPEILIENSNLFLFSRTSFVNNKGSRVGLKPLAFRMSEIEGIDIDTSDDFNLAELIHNNTEKFDSSI